MKKLCLFFSLALLVCSCSRTGSLRTLRLPPQHLKA